MTDGAGVPTGTPLTDPPLIEMISEDPVLRNTKLIAEAWDCAGLNQAGPTPLCSSECIACMAVAFVTDGIFSAARLRYFV